MNRNRGIAIIVAVVLIAGIGGLVWQRHSKAVADASKAVADASEAEVKPTAQITVAAVKSQGLSQTVTLYGAVEADPASVTTIAAPRAIIVSRVLVRVGQAVAAGQPLIELAGAPDAELAYHQAVDAATFAQSDLERVQRLYDAKLAASDQLIAAKKAQADTQAALANLQKQRGAGPGQTLTAPRAAIVTRLAVAPGDHVAQDAVLLALAGRDGLVAQLTLQPSASPVTAGAAVTLKPSIGGPPITSRIGLVAKAPNPDSKLLTATAPLPGSSLPVGAAVQGDVVIGGHSGLTAPRASVVFDETGAHVFTITGGKAHRVFVTTGAEQGDDIEISGPIKAGDTIAVEGAYELEDGMAVRVGAAKPAKADEP
jgi:RND family efflux transporter MFP subunit